MENEKKNPKNFSLDDVMEIFVEESNFNNQNGTSKEDLNKTIEELRDAELNYKYALLEYEQSKLDYELERDKNLLAIKDTSKELGLTNQSLRDAHVDLATVPEKEKVFEMRKIFYEAEVELNHLKRLEKRERLATLVDLYKSKDYMGTLNKKLLEEVD